MTTATELTEARWRKSSYSQGNGNCVEVAYLDATAVGCSTVRPPTGDPATVTVIARVLPDHRRQGFGEQLYQRGLARARELGARVIGTVVLASNEDGLRFARRHGFVETERYLLPGDTVPFVDLRLTGLWDPAAAGVLLLPSGRLVRGRALRKPLPPGPVPAFGVYLLGTEPPPVEWESRWLRWPDFRLPADRALAREVLREAWVRAAAERVEVACGGGRGRTGTALACLAVLDGVPADRAVAYVREHYDPHAVETPWQKRYVARFGTPFHGAANPDGIT